MSNIHSIEKPPKDNLPFEHYRVGGAVRDLLLHQLDKNITVKEVDWVVVGSSNEQMLALGFKQIGKNFPVFLHPKNQQEYALARTEKKQGKGYHGFSFDTSKKITLEEDLLRRDLTINAIAQDPKSKKLIDPYGGLQDFQNRQLKHISEAFDEDPLRVFRVARFYARFAYLGFSVVASTLEKMRCICQSDEIQHLSAERIWQETQLALQSRSPHLFFQILYQVGGLKYWYPEIHRLFGIPQPPKWHPEIDCGIHSLLVLEQAAKISDNLAVRFSALTHDLGKGTTPKDILPSHHGHEKRGIALVKNLCERLRTPNQIKKLAMLSAQWHTHFHRHQEMKPETYLKLLLSIDYFHHPEVLNALLIVSESDSKGRTGFRYKTYQSKAFWLTLADELKKFEATKAHTNDDFKKLSNEQKKQYIYQQRLAIVKKVLQQEPHNH